MASALQLTLPLFDPPSFEELLVQSDLSGKLVVTVQPRLRRGWRVRIARSDGHRQLYIPKHLADAPRYVKEALIDWALLPWRPSRAQRRVVRDRKKSLERLIWDHTTTVTNASRRHRAFDPDACAAASRGCQYDLREVFDSINRWCFSGSLHAYVRWGAPHSKTSYHMMKTDPSGNRVNLLTIAGIYDHPAVPRFAIEAIMFHEMLHIAIPPQMINGRRVVHGRAFKEAERSFIHFTAWREWEKTVLPRLQKSKQRVRFE